MSSTRRELLVVTTRTLERVAREARRIRARALGEGRAPFTRREFNRLVALSFGAAMVTVPRSAAASPGQAPGKAAFMVKIADESGGFRTSEADRQLRMVESEAGIVKARERLSMRIAAVRHVAPPVADMSEARKEATLFYVVYVDSGESPETIRAALMRSPLVEAVALVPKVKVELYSHPNDYFANIPERLNADEPFDWQNHVVGLETAHDRIRAKIVRDSITRPKMKVGISDTGIYEHEDVGYWLNEDEVPDNQLDDDNDGYVDNRRCWSTGPHHGACNPQDVDPARPDRGGDGHGTAVTGVAAAIWNNARGVTGAGFNLTEPVIAIYEQYEPPDMGVSEATTLFYLRDMGARVLNVSYGAGPVYDGAGDWIHTNADYYSMLVQLHDILNRDGVIVVAAAGNYGRDSTQGVDNLAWPAKLSSVVAVAGTECWNWHIDAGRLPALGSSKGRQYDGTRAVFAPGYGVAMPHWAQDHITQAYAGMIGYYAVRSGTSFAAPLVAGVMGALAYVTPELVRVNPPFFRQLVMGAADGLTTAEHIGGQVWDYAATSYMRGPPAQSGYDITSPRELWKYRVTPDDARVFRADMLAQVVTAESFRVPYWPGRPGPPRRVLRRVG